MDQLTTESAWVCSGERHCVPTFRGSQAFQDLTLPFYSCTVILKRVTFILLISNITNIINITITNITNIMYIAISNITNITNITISLTSNITN